MKRRIVVFGVTEPIIWHIRNKINPLKAEIVAYIDNNSFKQGYMVNEIPVVGINDIKIEDDIFFVIAGLSGYESIKEQLLSFGVKENRIQPLIIEEICRYCLGSLENLDIEFVKEVYFLPKEACKRIDDYMDIYREYANAETVMYEEDVFTRNFLISHAGGGYVNGIRIQYSNSKEALAYSLAKGFELIECDLIRVGDTIYAGHDYDTFYRAKEEGYTLVTVKELIVFLKENSQINLLIDAKWGETEEYEFYLNSIDDFIKKVCEDEKEKNLLKKRVIMEVYDEPTIKMAYEKGFKMFFTQYRNAEAKCHMKIVSLCSKYRISVVGISIGQVLHGDVGKFLPIILDKNIRVFVFSTDSIEDIVKLKQMGVNGVFTNYLTLL